VRSFAVAASGRPGERLPSTAPWDAVGHSSDEQPPWQPRWPIIVSMLQSYYVRRPVVSCAYEVRRCGDTVTGTAR